VCERRKEGGEGKGERKRREERESEWGSAPHNAKRRGKQTKYSV